MLSQESSISLEPLFCKSTGAYSAQVAQFCHQNPHLSGEFKLARARKPSLLDTDAWSTEVDIDQLSLSNGVIVKHGLRSTLNRAETDVAVFINPDQNFFVELKLPCCPSAKTLVRQIKTNMPTKFDSLAITLVRHGILQSSDKLLSICNSESKLFKVENWVQTLNLEGRVLARSLLSGRVIDLTENSFLIQLIESGDEYEADATSFQTFDQLCALGLFRKISSK